MTNLLSKLAAAAGAAALLLTGCTTAGGAAVPDESTPKTVKVAHAWGADDYPYQPKKVVATGTAVENLLSLGIKPDLVLVHPHEQRLPWRKGLDGVQQIVLTDAQTAPVEQIAAAKPDLIVGDFWYITEDKYKALKEIAPTLGGIGKTSEELGWQPQLKALGQIYGKAEVAQKVLDDDAALFAKAKQELPKLAGKTGVVAQFAKQRGMGVVVDPKEPGNSILYDLGMKVPDAFSSLQQRSGRAIVSLENISVIDADFMAVYSVDGNDDEIRAIPGYKDLRQVKQDATVYGGVILVQAMNTPSALSRAWVLEQIRPTLEKVGGQ